LHSTDSPKNAVILFNPLAGRGKASAVAAKAKKALVTQHWNVLDCIASTHAGHIEKDLASQFGDKVELFVLIGGDGTLRELIAGLRTCQLKPDIAFIPMGNANVVARELGIPLQANHAIEVLKSTSVKHIDIGVLKQEHKAEQIFLAMLEIGFGAKIVAVVDRLRNGSLKGLYKIWGDLVYAIAGLIALRGLSSSTFNTRIDNDTEYKTSNHAVFANMQTYAKGWSLTPDAKYDDGLLDSAVSQRNSAISTLITFMAAARRKKLKPTLMAYQTGKKIEIESENSLFVQIDGDPIEFAGNASITLERDACTIRVPD